MDTRSPDRREAFGPALSLEARPPYLARRQRQLLPERVARFGRWLQTELGLSAGAQIAAAEWVSFDARDTPHVTMVTVVNGEHQLAFSIAKPLEGIERVDLPPHPVALALGVRRRAGV